MKNKKKVLKVGIFCIILALILGVSVYVYNRGRETLPETGSNATAALTLTGPTTVLLHATSTFNVEVNTGGAHLGGVVIELNYDPTKIQIISVTKGALFPVEIVPATIANGLISFTYGVPAKETDPGVAGSGVVATITYKQITPGDTSFTFTGNTMSSAVEYIGNAIATKTGLTINSITPSLTNTPTSAPAGAIYVIATKTSTPIPSKTPVPTMNILTTGQPTQSVTTIPTDSIQPTVDLTISATITPTEFLTTVPIQTESPEVTTTPEITDSPFVLPTVGPQTDGTVLGIVIGGCVFLLILLLVVLMIILIRKNRSAMFTAN